MSALNNPREKFEDYLNALLASQEFTVREMSKSGAHVFPGAYGFRKPNESTICYIGITRTKTLDNRMGQHLGSNTASDASGWERRGLIDCKAGDLRVRCVRIDNLSERKYFEHYAIAVLAPQLNRE